MSIPGPIEGLRKKHALSDGTKVGSVRSTVGIVFENTHVAMVVPGGPAFKPSKDGRRIEKGDLLESIDSKEVTAANLIPLLRGNDVVGSHVLIVVKKGDTSQHETFNLQRSDIRAVEKMKDLFMKLAELQAESRAPRQEKVESLSKTLESQVLVVTDWFAWVEDKLRSHNEDLEKLVAEYMDKHQQTVEQSNKYLAEGTAVRKELLAAQQEHHMVKCDLEQTNKVINDKYGQLAAEMARLQEELERTRQSSYDELQAERERAAKELQQLRDRMSTEREDADSRGAKELAARIDAERQRFDTELKHLRGEMESASKRAAAVALALQTDLSSARSQIDQLKKELADMTLKADMARVDVARLERDLNQSRERSQELQQALAESAESLGHQLSKVALV